MNTLVGRGKSHPVFEINLGRLFEFPGENRGETSRECGLKGRRAGNETEHSAIPWFS